jgi:hypothetical protein
MIFELDEYEIKEFNKWKKNLPKIPMDVFGEEFQFTFKFHPTGLGVVKIIERDLDGEKLDLTDYSDW